MYMYNMLQKMRRYFQVFQHLPTSHWVTPSASLSNSHMGGSKRRFCGRG